jgi:hypothetical protein
MTAPNLLVRRATVEDVSKLLSLWKEEGLDCGDLEKRFAEFQLVQDGSGEILGAFALKIQGLEGWLHSETFAHADQADQMRDKLWERAQIQARNHGLVRIWSQLAVPFWHTNGFRSASNELLTKRPTSFGGDRRSWLVLQLREEPTGPAISIDKEFALFKEAEKDQREKIFRQARFLKSIATVVAVAVLAFVVVMSVRLFLKRPLLRAPQPVPPNSTNR